MRNQIQFFGGGLVPNRRVHTEVVPYVLFDTAIGRCGLAWSEDGVLAVGLPESDDALTEYLRGFGTEPGVPDAMAADAVARIVALLDGAQTDLTPVPVVLDVSEFDAAVYRITRAIAPGSTLTYGVVAARLGHPGAAQAVGGALGRNPVPIVIPCHRVLGAGLQVGGFSAPGGANTKEKILAIEGVAGFGEPMLF